jgi:hypothetical protein
MLRNVIMSIIIDKNDGTFHVAEGGRNSKIIGKMVGCEGWLWSDMVLENAQRWASELRVLLTQPQLTFKSLLVK